ncbi:hypothetical protein FISHEDRAFT_70073 [Fistulina hepatica ATCC 64428]|uniref:DNA/RNA polymerase n=1 Tax=Fistulina hepatica ATCC 64428 TaxID=1128425 RepID=A0A0D7AJS6_9AGAR|nr:hypothetical protein FISHEDRAFT_70073 [Fistulina hepatica ATCC 64428]
MTLPKTGKPLGPMKKRYKPVAKCTYPVKQTTPEEFQVVQNITGDPLENMLKLSPHPRAFMPTGCYTAEHKAVIDVKAFTWVKEEKGQFQEQFFPPVEIPVIAHTPWVLKNMPIPPGIHDEVIRCVREKITSGTYKPSSSSYRSRWFTVIKKDGVSLRLVHDLQPLNTITIQNSGMLPFTEQAAEQLEGRACISKNQSAFGLPSDSIRCPEGN